jgi:hypothetical protein
MYNPKTQADFGFACLVETDNQSILFDTGKFNPDDKDDFKFLVSPTRDYDRSKLNQL